MGDERRYDEREVGLILERVAELHRREGERHDARAMTREEIEGVVSELGISKALVARATNEIAVRDRNQPSFVLGGKTDVLFEDEFEGSVDEAGLHDMLDVLRRHLGDPGELKEEGGARIWSSTDASTRRIHFTVVERRGRTTLRLEESMPADATGTVGVSTALGGVAGIMTAIPLKALVAKSVLLLALGPATVGGLVLGWLVGRAIWKRRGGGREGQLQRAFGEVRALAESKD